MQKNNLAIILSGGTGKRFDISKPKQFYKLNKKTIIETTVEKFVNSNFFNHIIVVIGISVIIKTILGFGKEWEDF